MAERYLSTYGERTAAVNRTIRTLGIGVLTSGAEVHALGALEIHRGRD